jgi:hypothetical protein
VCPATPQTPRKNPPRLLARWRNQRAGRGIWGTAEPFGGLCG